MMFVISLVLTIVVCTLLSIRTKHLLFAALWLATSNAAVAAFLYALGAHEIAVIELSVGTGLVPVLFVFAVSMMGHLSSVPTTSVSRPLAYSLVGICALLILFSVPSLVSTSPPAFTIGSFSHVLWEDRGLEMLLQIVLIFAGVISILNLLSASRRPAVVRTREDTSAVGDDQREFQREAV
jgi:NADH:ubiquinone oxidoreductase subunit 6 (subunit J)